MQGACVWYCLGGDKGIKVARERERGLISCAERGVNFRKCPFLFHSDLIPGWVFFPRLVGGWGSLLPFASQ